MPTLRLVLSAALAALLLAPLGAAASGHGDLKLNKLGTLPGDSSFEAATAALRWAGDGAPTLDLAASDVSIDFYGTNETTSSAPLLPSVAVRGSDVTGTAHHDASRLALRPDLRDATVTFANGGPVTAKLSDATVGADQGVLLGTARGTRATSSDCDPRWCVAVHGVYELATTTTDATLAGDLTLLVHGATLLVTDSQGEHAYKTGLHVQNDYAATQTTTDVWAFVKIQHASGTFASRQPVSWYATAPTIKASAFNAESAVGSLAVGMKNYAAAEEPVDLAGALSLTGAPVASGAFVETPGKPTPASDFTLHVAGDVQSVNLRATPIYQDKPAETIGIAAAIALAVALVAYSWQHIAYGAAALYTRLKQPTILDNEVRNNIYEIIRTNPGISARAVHRHSSQSWGTVVYHLRQLERHQLVVSRSVGRTRNYYENHGKYRGMEVQLACLQSERARVLARLVLAAPGITQEELVEKSAFPQPTTSYYIRKLKASALVEERREGRYARYHPLGELGRFLELADASATPTVGLSDGVQA